MIKLRLLIILMGLFSFSNVFAGSTEDHFWRWFEKNEKSLFGFETDRERIFDGLAKQLMKVHPDLTFEFGPIQKTGKREFVVSAGGMKKAFPAVEALIAAAPILPRWQFMKYRQRRHPINDIEFAGKTIRAKDVSYGLYKDDKKVGLVLFFNGYNEKEKDIFGNIGYLFLDEALGEYDTEMKVGFIEFHGRESKLFKDARPLVELPSAFDAAFMQLRN